MISDASPMHMARDLVARHSDIGFIRGYILNFFGRAPTREKLEELRAEYLEAQAFKRDRRNAVLSDEKRGSTERRRQIAAAAAKRYRDRKAA